MSAPRTGGGFVFVGSTLSWDDTLAEGLLLQALPPVQRGEVYSLVVSQRPRVIGIIDGLFEQVPAVIHKEILFALSEGVRVVGGASMGALRAAELWPYGMEGVGRIFERYRSGAWEDDDEVAVSHGDAEAAFRPFSDAMASLRLGLLDATEERVITERTATALCELSKAQFYSDRSWGGTLKLGEGAGLPHEELKRLRAFIRERQPNAKREDGLAVIARVRDLLRAPAAPYVPTFDFEPTLYWDRLVARTRAIAPAVEEGGLRARAVTLDDLRRHLPLRPGGEEVRRGAVLLHLLEGELERSGDEPSPEEIKLATHRFRRANGLLSTRSLEEWLTRQQMTRDELSDLMRLEAASERLLARERERIHTRVPSELQRRGQFEAVAGEIEAKKRLLAESGIRSFSEADVGASLPDILSWYQRERGSIEGTLPEHASALGFESVRELVSEIFLEYKLARGKRVRPTGADSERR